MNEENNSSHENTKQCRLHLSTTNLQLTNNDDTPPTSDEDDVSDEEEESDIEPDEEEGNLLLQELGFDTSSSDDEEYAKTNDSTLHSNYYNSDSEEEESDCSTSSSDEQDDLLEESEEEEEEPEEEPFTEDELQDYLENMCDSRESYEVQPSSLLAAVEQPQQLDIEEESDIDEEEINDDVDDEDEYYTDRSSQETESVTSTTIGTPLKLSQVSSTSANNNNNYDDKPDHELFLPLFCSPHTERLNIPDEGDGLSDTESDYFYSGQRSTVYGSGARTGGYGSSNNPYLHRTYMVGNRVVAPTRPRMWDGYGCNHYQQHQQRQQLEDQNSPTVSDSSEEDNLSQASVDSSSSNKDGNNEEEAGGGKQSVSFDTSVTVYPIYETSQYSSDMVQQMYTNREELRINKLRNKREYAHDSFNWRDVTEEDGMTVDDESGELVHPVHTVADVKRNKKPLGSNIKVTTTHGPGPSIRNVVRQTYSSALGGYTSMTMGGGGHRTKRMRMCW